jgi:hypothetical protein
MQVRPLSILTALVVVIAAIGIGTWFYLDSSHVESRPGSISDGPTLYEAIAAVNRTLPNVTGGPWGLFSIYGVAAQAPYSANVVGYPSMNETANACGEQFNGLTLWNGTMPTFNGSLNSGTAPFWQFAYYSNTSQQILLATNVLGSAHLYAPMPVNGTCHPWYDLGNPNTWVKELASFLTDSPNIAQPALAQVGKLSWFPGSGPWAEIFTSGPGVFDGFGDLGGAAGIILDRCGLSGVSDIQPLVLWAESLNGTGGGYANESTNCAFVNYPYFAGYGSYDWIPGSPSTNMAGATLQLSIPYQVGFIEHNQTSPYFFDAWGLANWMTSWNLTTGSEQPLPLAPSTCREWVPAVGDCLANTSGWFAVVLSSGGSWIDSYGSLPGGQAGWSEPVTALVSDQQLVIILPSSWSVSGVRLTVASTVTTSTLVGSVAL